MKGHSHLVLLLGVVILLCAAILGNAASAHQSSALSSNDEEDHEGVIDGEQVQNEEKGVLDEEEEQDQEEDLIGDFRQGSPGTKGNSTKSSFTTECECGKQEDETRIIGGVPTTRGKHPWQAALLLAADDTLLCGGTLINNLYILTSAFCVLPYQTDPASIVVRLRDYNLKKPDQHKEITKNVIEIIPHQRFDPYTALAYDIALLKLESALSLSQLATVRPICLPSTKTELYEMEKAIATGWGIKSPFSANPSSILNEVKLRVVSNDRCRNAIPFYDPSLIKNNMMCAGNENENTCFRDQGGPLAYLNNGGYYEQIGVTSFSVLCGLYDQPSVFTRVNKFLPWIERRAVGATYCRGFSFPE